MEVFSGVAASSGNRRRGDDSAFDDDNEKSFFDNTLYTFFVNIAYEDFHFPLIGFVNIARGNFKTLELGFFNWNTRNFTGLQAGFINTSGGNVLGVQAGYINTIGGNITGVQSGFINTAMGNITGVQNGFINTAAGGANGMQFGFVNTATGSVKGLQAGFVNTAVKGGQGLQLGFVNTSIKEYKGMQIGFINYTDSIENGIPIGLISIVRHGGYYALEYSFSEYYPFTLGFKVGVEKFYSTIFVGFSPFEDNIRKMFAAGFGVGSILPITPKFFFNPELINLSHIYSEGEDTGLITFVPYFGYNINRNFSVVAGPSVTWAYDPDGEDMVKPFFSLLNHDINEKHSIIIGARAAVRFRF
jgi:hypothetical protein